jgi:hypothetical protein
MKRWVKKFFCLHDWHLVEELGGDLPVYRLKGIYKCCKCAKKMIVEQRHIIEDLACSKRAALVVKKRVVETSIEEYLAEDSVKRKAA